MNSEALAKTTTGHVVNLISNDVNRFDQLMIVAHFVYLAPMELAFVVWLAWREVGVACLGKCKDPALSLFCSMRMGSKTY